MKKKALKLASQLLTTCRHHRHLGEKLSDAALHQHRHIYTDRSGYQHFNKRHSSATRQQGQARLLAIMAAGGGVVYFSSLQEIPYTKRRHAILISPESEMQLGEATWQQITAQAQSSRTLLPSSSPPSQLVRKVASKIAHVTSDGYGGGYQEHLKRLKWDVAVINSPQVNAFVVPGGKIVVYTGLLSMLSSEDELAAVLAHEVAHVVARHGAERLTQGSFIELGRMLLYLIMGLPIPSGPLTAVFFLPNSRKAETEADVIGIQLAARACYDPSAAVSVFEKLGRMEEKSGAGGVPKFLRTHPHSSDRIVAIKKMLSTAESLYESNGCGGGLGGQFMKLVVKERSVSSSGEW